MKAKCLAFPHGRGVENPRTVAEKRTHGDLGGCVRDLTIRDAEQDDVSRPAHFSAPPLALEARTGFQRIFEQGLTELGG